MAGSESYARMAAGGMLLSAREFAGLGRAELEKMQVATQSKKRAHSVVVGQALLAREETPWNVVDSSRRQV
jgi:hypothetical protein